jgi:AcrR family transcriptional regulator
MVEAASRHGYGGATVARVTALAGASRATFYQHFSSREDCFLAAYREKAREVTSTIGAAAAAASPAERPHAVLDVLFGELIENRPLARFLLIEPLGAPQAVRSEHEALLARADGLVAGFLQEQDPDGAIQIPSAALVAAVGEVLARQALAEEPEEPSRLRSDLGRWIDAYRLPSGMSPLSQQDWRDLGRFARVMPPEPEDRPPLLARGRSALPAEGVAGARRRRILDATARLSLEEGYAAITVAQIAAAARVPRAAFYSLFEAKREALMAAQTRGLQEAMAVAAAEYSPAAPWPRRVWNMARGFLTYLGERPHYAHLDFVESYAAGPEAVRHRQQNHMVFALFLEDGYRHCPDASRLPWACTEAIAGGVLGLIRNLLIEGRAERMLSLLPEVAYVSLAPFIGPVAAADQVRQWAQAAR